jgi:hypothetical protein
VKISEATTVMAVVILIWCGVTLAVKGVTNAETPPKAHGALRLPDLAPQMNYETPPSGIATRLFLQGTKPRDLKISCARASRPIG